MNRKAFHRELLLADHAFPNEYSYRMQQMKNIIFDLGGVILNIDNQLTEEAFIRLGVKNFKDIFGHGHAASFVLEYEVGRITDQQFIRALKEISGLSLDDEQILAAWNVMLLDFPPERIRLLDELRTHFRLFLFSNTNALHVSELKKRYRSAFNNRELDDHFEKAYYSQILGMRKPELKSFQHIIDENDLIPEETLFVDDALINVEGAKTAGLRGYFLKPGKTILDIEWPY